MNAIFSSPLAIPMMLYYVMHQGRQAKTAGAASTVFSKDNPQAPQASVPQAAPAQKTKPIWEKIGGSAFAGAMLLITLFAVYVLNMKRNKETDS